MMKQIRFFPITILLGLLALIFACKKDNDNLVPAVVTGFDLRECACCGGWFIKIDNTTYRFDQIPAGSTVEFDGSTVFPKAVRVEWQKKDPSCLNDEIVLSKLEED